MHLRWLPLLLIKAKPRIPMQAVKPLVNKPGFAREAADAFWLVRRWFCGTYQAGYLCSSLYTWTLQRPCVQIDIRVELVVVTGFCQQDQHTPR
jgi:hypothetical protein